MNLTTLGSFLVGLVMFEPLPLLAGNSELRAGLSQTATFDFVPVSGINDCIAQSVELFSTRLANECFDAGLCGVQEIAATCQGQTITATYRCVGNSCFDDGSCACGDRPANTPPLPLPWPAKGMWFTGRVPSSLSIGKNAAPPSGADAPLLNADLLAPDSRNLPPSLLGNAEKRALGIPVE